MKIEKTLIIADLHLGITRELWKYGVRLPSQVELLQKRLRDLQRKTKTSRLVILGDVKHTVTGASFQEQEEIPRFFEGLKFRSIVITKGNHDGQIERILPRKVRVKKSFDCGPFTLSHGHMTLKTGKKYIVIGHNQPHVKLQDPMGAFYIEPVWVRGPLTGPLEGKELIIMPPFNELCGAGIINQGPITGPIAKRLDTQEAHVYLLDGTDLGTVDDLRIEE